MNISIGGSIGSGKSTVCKILEKKYGYELISAGELFRQYAEEQGLTVVELNELAKSDRSIDDHIDKKIELLGKEKDNIVFDSRMAWFFVPDSFRVFLHVEPEEAARRILLGDARRAEQHADFESVKEEIIKRTALERERFLQLYGVDYFDTGAEHYDFFVSVGRADPETIAYGILVAAQNLGGGKK